MTEASGELIHSRATSNDVARLAGVSQSTVSRAFTPGTNISQATRKLVFDAAQRLNYVPNSIARSLITRQSNIIAVVLGDIRNPFYAVALDEFALRLQELGKHVLFFRVSRGSEVDDALRRVLQYQVDGIVVTAAQVSMKMATSCVELGIPVVMFNRYVPGLMTSTVCCDNVHGGGLAADALVSAGGRRFAVIHGDRRTTTNIDRMLGFRQRLEELGFRATDLAQASGHYTYEGGHRAALALLARPDRPDALFCTNDIMALGAIDATRYELRLDIPRDLVVVGFDDIPEAARHAYDLTTVQQPMKQMIDETLDLLFPEDRSLQGGQSARFLKGALMARGSTRRGEAGAS